MFLRVVIWIIIFGIQHCKGLEEVPFVAHNKLLKIYGFCPSSLYRLKELYAMNRLFIPTLGPTDWRRLLANPSTQWKRYKSALEMAVCWESARDLPRGLPPEVAKAIDTEPQLSGAHLLIGLPEHKVSFVGGRHPSQNDLWALLRVKDKLVSMAVEAKAGEKLDDIVKDWLAKGVEKSRKPERLTALKQQLSINNADVSQIRYQLLHRAASALKEAERFGAPMAVMLIQSFNRAADEESWKDFMRFGEIMGATVKEGGLVKSQRPTAVPLFIGWVTSQPADLGRLSSAV